MLPEPLLDSLKNAIGFDRETFEMVHVRGEPVTSIRINPSKKFEIRNSKFEFSPVPWCSLGFYLSHRPSFTFDPLFHAGCYYVQEASSMFLEQAIIQTVDVSKPLRVLDLAAAPGGKSTHLQSLISKNSLLVSNEVIRSRSHVLQDNIIKWGSDNVVVTNNDPSSFAMLENYFDVILVDAPCSGSGLFRKDPAALEEWSENNVQLCSRRQQRILADVWPALKKNGILVYSTCSYSMEEDEEILEWLNKDFEVESCPIKIDESWGITSTGNSYRFWPDKVKGEGFFIGCVKKLDGREGAAKKGRIKFERLTSRESGFLENWVNPSELQYLKFEDKVFGIPQSMASEINLLASALHINYLGTMLGELMHDKLVPAHALAMNSQLANPPDKLVLNKNEATRYLQKKDLGKEVSGRGWKLVTYENFPLGWINVLPNRINNYYPKELRILKDI